MTIKPHWVITLATLVACNYEGIDFPEADDADAGECGAGDAVGSGAAGLLQGSGAAGGGSGGVTGGDLGGSGIAGSLGGGGGGDDFMDLPTGLERYELEAPGFPAPGGVAEGCSPTDEVCGNGTDDDCDGVVDENAQVGQGCPLDCEVGGGNYACDLVTNTVQCVTGGLYTCTTLIKGHTLVGCGDGVRVAPEDCDPRAEGEVLDVTCTADCRLPLFPHCAAATKDSCPAYWTECDEWVGACLPALSDRRKRCPDIPIEDEPEGHSSAFYKMVEFEGRCRLSCSDESQCPTSLPRCYMSYCVPAY